MNKAGLRSRRKVRKGFFLISFLRPLRLKKIIMDSEFAVPGLTIIGIVCSYIYIIFNISILKYYKAHFKRIYTHILYFRNLYFLFLGEDILILCDFNWL